jgi:capsular exopolysaccharide synthesis family protein
VVDVPVRDRLRPRKRHRRLVDPGAPSAEPFRSLRLALQLRPDQESGNIVAFTSAEPGDGKSTVAANYALISALSHGTVLLIDGDLRKPKLHEIFNIPRSPGLTEALAAGGPIDDFVLPVPALGNLAVLPAGRPIPRSGDLASSSRMGELLGQASRQYALVVLDSPPVLTGADAAGLASQEGVDVVLVVNRSSRRRAVTKALRKLELIEANIGGIVVNRQGRLTTYAY